MIDLQTGMLSFYDKSIELSPLHNKSDILSLFPQNSIKRVRDMGNGYVWYDLIEQIYSDDYSIPVRLCFNPEGYLEFINIYPQCFDKNKNCMWADWTADAMEKDKKYCDDWLRKYCSLENSQNTFFWGELSSFYDPRYCSCGIVIHYNK